MSSLVSPSDWSTTRGESWRDHLSPLEAMLAPVNQHIINALNLDQPCRIADIGCGGGETSLAIARASVHGSHVDGFDISPALVDAANAKPQTADVSVQFHVADAAKIPPSSQGYDRLVSRFGVMFFPDDARAFSNLAKCLKVGGQFAFAVWGPPADNPWMSGTREVIAKHITLPTPDTNAPGPFRYQDAPTLKALLEEAGFAQMIYETQNMKLALGGGMEPTECVDFVLSAFSIGQAVDDADSQVENIIRTDLNKLFSSHLADGKVVMDACVHIVTGQRAGSSS